MSRTGDSYPVCIGAEDSFCLIGCAQLSLRRLVDRTDLNGFTYTST